MLRATLFACAIGALGGAAAFGQTTLFTWKAAGANDEFGFSVSNAGDVNDDGYPDVIVGAPDVTSQPGGARVLSGKDGSVLYKLGTGINGDQFGRSVSAAGDVDHDDYADVIVGAPFLGTAYVFSGRTGQTIWMLTGQYGFGFSVSSAGDVDGDGTNDVIVGNPQTGKATVFSGSTGHSLWVWAGDASHAFGYSVSSAGDVNNDGHDDVIVGAPYANANGPDCGRATIFSGKDGSQLQQFDGLVAYMYLGFSVSDAGDVDQDGRGDVIVGAPGGGAAVLAGAAMVYSGKTGSLIYYFAPAATLSEFGYSVSRARDVDGDGIPDLLIGAPKESTAAPSAGRVWLYSGKNGSKLADIKGTRKDGLFGFSVSTARDANRDGQADYVVGATGEDGGTARLYSGRDCDAAWRNYGSGWPGTHGVPSFAASDDPVLCRSITLDLENSRGAATSATLFTGFAQGQEPTTWGGTILVSPPWFLNTFVVPSGGAHLPVDIICDSALCGLSAYLQVLELDPGASKSVSFTRGLQLTIGGS